MSHHAHHIPFLRGKFKRGQSTILDKGRMRRTPEPIGRNGSADRRIGGSATEGSGSAKWRVGGSPFVSEIVTVLELVLGFFIIASRATAGNKAGIGLSYVEGHFLQSFCKRVQLLSRATSVAAQPTNSAQT
jgi:hypothetical protein